MAGNGNDVVAEAQGGVVVSAEGFFDPTVDLLYVNSVKAATATSAGETDVRAYGLQINPETFQASSAACANSPNAKSAAAPGTAPTCDGWIQFLFDSDPSSSSIYLEIWLFDYGKDCPGDGGIPQLTGMPAGAKWLHPPVSSGPPSDDCYYNSPPAQTASIDITNLGTIHLIASTTTGVDSVLVFANNTALVAALPDSILGFAPTWTKTEFNVFGIDDAKRADFSDWSALVAHLLVNNGTNNPPILSNDGFTGETNTLTLQLPGCTFPGNPPSIQFEEFQGNYKAATTCPPQIVAAPTPPINCSQAKAQVAKDQAKVDALADWSVPSSCNQFPIRLCPAEISHNQAVSAANSILAKDRAYEESICH